MLRFLFTLLILSGTAFPSEALRLLKDECWRCHNAEKRKGGLLMTSREALLQGGDNGPVLTLDQPGNSSLLTSLSDEADPHMPPKEQLSAAQIDLVRRWIEAGAPWTDLDESPAAAPARLQFGGLPDAFQPITALALSPDQRYLAAGRGDAILLFDLQEDPPREAATLLGHRDAVQSLAWSGDGAALASGGYRRIVIWDATAGWERAATLEAPLAGRVTALQFMGSQLVGADSPPAGPSHLQVWSLADWSHDRTLAAAHDDTIYALATRPGEGDAPLLLATGSADKTVALWDPQTWERRTVFEGHTGYVLALAFGPEGKRVASAGDDEAIKVWNLETRKQIHSFSGGIATRAVTGVIWGTDPAAKDPATAKDWLVAVSEDGKPRAYTDLVVHDGTQRSGGARARAWTENAHPLTAIALLPERGWIVAGDVTGALRVWDTKGTLQDIALGESTAPK